MTYTPDNLYKTAIKLAPQLGVAPPESADPEDLLKWHAMISPVVEQKKLDPMIPALENFRRSVRKI
jgi:hypothetical protein